MMVGGQHRTLPLYPVPIIQEAGWAAGVYMNKNNDNVLKIEQEFG
jgi:hypothetical protein